MPLKKGDFKRLFKGSGGIDRYLKTQQITFQTTSYTRDGKEVFLQTTIIQDAVIRNFEIIGEATKRLSPDIRGAYPDVPWQQVAGFRDVPIVII
ncbi:DUF86 domain-containing protein [Tolypothrix campylonemoides VB511288_2]|uniref:DUF86 domain-containing protein n=1 Tax=Tolypothrix campylonemoides VB511288_2 TaxID=3232311 RepID=A0ABW8X2F8_9CYAN